MNDIARKFVDLARVEVVQSLKIHRNVGRRVLDRAWRWQILGVVFLSDQVIPFGRWVSIVFLSVGGDDASDAPFAVCRDDPAMNSEGEPNERRNQAKRNDVPERSLRLESHQSVGLMSIKMVCRRTLGFSGAA